MEKKETALTNQSVRQKFKSQFELVNYAIKLADHMIRSGRAPRVSLDNHNPAVLIIGEIDEGKDQVEDIVVTTEIIAQPQLIEIKVEKAVSLSKPTEKKKARRILA
jgi:hypothetical protein